MNLCSLLKEVKPLVLYDVEHGIAMEPMKGKEESEKVSLKFNIQKMKFLASSPITSRQIDGETMEAVTEFIFLGS